MSGNEICEWMAYDRANSDDFRVQQAKELKAEVISEMPIKNKVALYKNMLGHIDKKQRDK